MSYLNVTNVSHSFGGRQILENVSFKLLRGEHVGLVGANGEGKSTFLNIVTGHVLPDEGKVEWPGKVTVGYLDQQSTLEKGMTIREVLRTAFDGMYAMEQQMLELINRDRLAHGLQPLQADMRLTRLARLKSQDIVDNNYFDHRSPTYGTAFDMFRANGIIFIRGGENLSKAGSVQVSHLRLMNSPNHRANLLNPYFTHIGIGIVNINPSGVVVTQMFIQAP